MAIRYPGKFLFLETPRAASSAMRNALVESRALNGKRFYGHKRHERVSPEEGEVVASVVRDPLGLLQSWYRVYVKFGGKLEPEAFVASWENLPEIAYVLEYEFRVHGPMLHHFAEQSDYLLCYERLQKDLDELMAKLDLEERPLLKEINSIDAGEGKDRDAEIWNAAAIQAARQRFADDFELYENVLRHGHLFLNRAQSS